jgi:uncharacterized protein with ParB-like and HNH nuclease domain/predicted transport protein
MKATEANFIQFLQGKNNQFIIPIYQRTYSWTIDQCNQLWEDVLRVASRPEIPGHFIGSIVYIAKGIYKVASTQQLLVIDGQQRLTTLSLLLLALAKALEIKPESAEINSKKIKNYYLVNSDEEGELHYKLMLTQTDKDTLISLIDNHPKPSKFSHRIVENYQFFEKAIKDCKIDLTTIFKGIEKLIIVDVSLDREQDNPQLIFESLNSTGLELSQADLIRNFILMGLEPKEQNDLYRDFWFPMEESFGQTYGSVYFDRFMRDYLTIKNKGRIPKIDEVYIEFKSYLRSNPSIGMQEIVADLYRYSKHFIKLAFEKETDSEIKSAIEDINILKVDVVFPFLLEVLDDFEKNLVTREDLVTIIRLIESYVFRRVICGIPTNSLNKTFATLYGAINKTDYVESLKASLLLGKSYRRFPDNEEFQKEFVNKDVYNFRNRNYLLRKLENAYRKKELIRIEGCTIEHILPQNEKLSEQWKRDLGPDWQRVQNQYLHTIGNLTLTGYNSEYSDHTFLEKRDYPERRGFRNSPLYLNEYLSTIGHWDEQTIKERARILSDHAANIWKIPSLPKEVLEKYQSVEKGKTEDEEYTLEHYIHLQGKILEVFNAFSHQVLNIDSSVYMDCKKLYIAFKSTTNFVDVVPQKSRLLLSLNMPFSEIHDPDGLCKNIAGHGKWGNGEVEVSLTSIGEIDTVMGFVEQAFLWQTEN